MTTQEYTDLILARPPCTAWSVTDTMKKTAVVGALPMALDMICNEYDFPFVVDEAEETATTSQTYTLKGRDDDARDIVSIRYGSSKSLLDKYTQAQSDEWRSGQSDDTTAPQFWIRIADNNGFPQIELVGTVTSGTILYYRYRKSNLTVEMFPKAWSFVLVSAIEALLFGTVNVASNAKGMQAVNPLVFNEKFDDDLAKMIDNYERGGGGDQVPPLSSQWKNKNRRRNDLHGYS